MDEKNERRFPKKAFDKEYSTDWRKEVAFLRKEGIQPTFTKLNEYSVERYKYTKTPELFAALAVFYKQIQDEFQWRKINEMLESVKDVPASPEAIKLVADTILDSDVDTSNIHSMRELADILAKGKIPAENATWVRAFTSNEEDDTE